MTIYISQMSHPLQITQLSDLLTGDTVIVGNTHLHHDPKHEHYKVRALTKIDD